MTGQDWARVSMMGNEIAMQWYALVQNKPLPAPAGTTISAQPIPGGGYQFSAGGGALLLVGLAIIAAVYLLRD